MNDRWLTIKQLDRQLKEWQAVCRQYGRPRVGWVRTLRAALNMSAEQLANRLGLTRSRITQLENAEIHDAVTIRTMKEVANAMECEFVYAIVPKNNSSLEAIIKARAEQVANEKVNRVAHSMSLEAQSVDNEALKMQKNELTEKLTTRLNKKLWAELKNQNKSAEDVLKKLIQNLQKKRK